MLKQASNLNFRLDHPNHAKIVTLGSVLSMHCSNGYQPIAYFWLGNAHTVFNPANTPKIILKLECCLGIMTMLWQQILTKEWLRPLVAKSCTGMGSTRGHPPFYYRQLGGTSNFIGWSLLVTPLGVVSNQVIRREQPIAKRIDYLKMGVSMALPMQPQML